MFRESVEDWDCNNDPVWARARAALLMGDFNRGAKVFPHHPEWFAQIQNTDRRADLHAKTNEILEGVLCESRGALKLLAENSSSVFSLRNREAAVLIVLAAMHEPGADTLVKKVFLDVNAPTPKSTAFQRQEWEATRSVYDKVQARLEKPLMPLETEAAQVMTPKAKKFWSKSLAENKNVNAKSTARKAQDELFIDGREPITRNIVVGIQENDDPILSRLEF